MIDIPTALTESETRLLRQVARDRRVYEAGALLGYSTVALAQVAREVVSVDPHTGYPRDDPRPTWHPFRRNLRRYGVEGVVRPIRNYFQNVPPLETTELAFADLIGEAQPVAQFLRLAEHVPIVAVHDYALAGCESATHAIDLFIRRKRPSVIRADTLIVMEDRQWQRQRSSDAPADTPTRTDSTGTAAA